MNSYRPLLACFTLVSLGVACSSGSSVPSPGGSNPVAPGGTLASGQTHGLVLTPVIGEGSGIINVTANARTGGFVANTEDVVHVKGVTPDTLLYVRVAADAGLPGGQQGDGTCQRAALGQFGPLALFPGGPPATLQTSPGGAGTVHIVFGATTPSIADGSLLDLQFRVVDALPPAVPTIDLRTDCFTIQIK